MTERPAVQVWREEREVVTAGVHRDLPVGLPGKGQEGGAEAVGRVLPVEHQKFASRGSAHTNARSASALIASYAAPRCGPSGIWPKSNVTDGVGSSIAGQSSGVVEARKPNR
jgi:hypothetical protein